jgi:hypothetical protein
MLFKTTFTLALASLASAQKLTDVLAANNATLSTLTCKESSNPFCFNKP